MREYYENQVHLLLDVLPTVMKDNRFALKGGTAINLFYREMPRLSIDIDLCYLPIEDRPTSFNNIHEILSNIKSDLEQLGFEVKSSKPLNGKSETKLFVSNTEAEIKVEPNFTLRGSVIGTQLKTTTKVVKQEYRKEVEVNCLTFEDIFGGKICAALDRQHPRDLFDIKLLFENEGLIDSLRKSFITYLLSHPRPIHEVLQPNMQDISKAYNEEFKGMVKRDTNLNDLIDVRSRLIEEINTTLSMKERKFIQTFQAATPDWSLFPHKIQELPSIKWKLINLMKLKTNNPKKHEQLANQLKEKLGT
ncbi:nucleotidyl transferase AbiEii/AbiGii toxin family protein [Bdellovibrionales bacterium]|nr:nucleotidyl transferase AbiEii/AbiGii toxin family protein [Bdellovibrionales bacterium]